MNSAFQYMWRMLVNMLAALPLIAGFRWICAIYRKKKGKTVTAAYEVGVWIFLAYLAGLFYQTIVPELMAALQGVEQEAGRVNLQIFLVFRQTWIEVFRNGNPAYFFINFLGNILVFVPLGFLTPFLWKRFRRFWKVTLLGAGVSLGIETVQLLLPRGTDIDDIWLNTLGAVLGYLLWRLADWAAVKGGWNMEKIRELCKKYRELISYLIFGVLTTVVNYVVYLIAAPFFSTATIPTAIAWIFAVVFAYVTNRKYVFHSKATGAAALAAEIGSFFGARLLSGLLDVGFMWVTADKLGLNDKIMKLVANVFVVVFNYIASKLVIFRKKAE